MWGFEQEDVIPDIVTLGNFVSCRPFSTAAFIQDCIHAGKPMGNGFPIGGVICRTHLAEAIDEAKLFSTFGGSPPAAAAGKENEHE